MHIRDYRASDRDACLALFESNVPRFFDGSEREQFLGFLDGGEGRYLVVEDDEGRVIACGGVAVRDGIADLCWGMVDQRLHGQGVGGLFTRERIRIAREEMVAERMELCTSQHTAGFYERHGFERVKETPDGFGPGVDRIDMVKAL